jgi:hypothetical protein
MKKLLEERPIEGFHDVLIRYMTTEGREKVRSATLSYGAFIITSPMGVQDVTHLVLAWCPVEDYFVDVDTREEVTT